MKEGVIKMGKRNQVKRITEEGKEIIYRDLEEASKDIPSKLENWKIQLFIAQAINTNTKAFKSAWKKAN